MKEVVLHVLEFETAKKLLGNYEISRYNNCDKIEKENAVLVAMKTISQKYLVNERKPVEEGLTKCFNCGHQRHKTVEMKRMKLQ